MHRVEGLSIREISKRTGLHRKTVRRAIAAEQPARYARAPAGSKLDPFREWICEQLEGDPRIQSQRLREMAAEVGYQGGKTIFDDYVREVRPRFLAKRTFQRTLYRPGELVQCDLWEPRAPIAVGHGQTRRGWVVTVELCWARVIAGALIFSKQAPDILWGLGRGLSRIGALPEKLVWDREGAIAPLGRPTEAFAAFCGQLGVGWVILDAGDAQAKGVLERSHRFMRTNFESGRRFANPLDFQLQLDGWCDRVNGRVHRTHPRRPGRAAGRGAAADAAAAGPVARLRPPPGPARSAAAISAPGSQRLLDRPGVRRAPRRGPRLADRGVRGRARQRRARVPAPPQLRRWPDGYRSWPSDAA